jgi:hypothetical protein
MSRITRQLDGQTIETTDAANETIEFIATDEFSPNLLRKSNKQVIFPNLGRGNFGNAVQIIFDSIANFGIQRLLNYKEIISSDLSGVPDVEIFNGNLHPEGKKTYYETEHEIEDDCTTFAEWSKTTNLRDFAPNTSVSDDELRSIFNDVITPITDLRTKYLNSLIDPAFRLTPPDFTEIKYLNARLKALDILILLISVVMLILQIAEIIKQIFDSTGSTAILPPLGVVLAISLVAKLLLLSTFIVIYMIEWNEAIPKPQTSRGVSLKTLFTKIAGANGYTLKSTTILDIPNNNFIIWENLDNCIPNQNVFEFINEWSVFFNAKMRLVGNVLEFEKINYYWNNPENYTIPLMEEPDTYTENYPDINGLFRFEFAQNEDSKEKRFGEKATVRYTRSDAPVGEKQFNSKNEVISSRYSRAYEKTELTAGEITYNVIVAIFVPVALIISAVSAIFGGTGLNFFILSDNVGCIQLSDNYISVPKLLLVDSGGRVTTERNAKYVNMAYIYNEFHAYMSPSRQGQWIKVEGNSPRLIGTTNPDLALFNLVRNNVCFIEIADNEKSDVYSTHLFVINKLVYSLQEQTIEFEGYALKTYTNPNKIKESILVD